jgi:hypothetical protein
LLERAFRDTYGMEMKDIFGSEDLALGPSGTALAPSFRA